MIVDNVFSVSYTLVIAVAIVFCLKLFTWLRSIYLIRKNLREQWQGTPCHWFWGHAKMIAPQKGDYSRMLEFFANEEKKFPYGVALYFGPTEALLRIHHPKIIKEILQASYVDTLRPKSTYKMFFPWLGNGLFLAEGNEWLRQRRLLTHSFHFDILKSYARIMNSCTDTLIEKWKQSLDSQKPLKVEIFNAASLLTLDTILKCLLSYNSNCQTESERNPYISSIIAISELIIRKQNNPNPLKMFNWFYFRSEEGKTYLKECDNVHEFSDAFIRKRKKNPHLPGHNEIDFLDLLLNAKDSDGNGFSDFEIRSQLDTFFIAGYDTTASAMSWCLYCLASHPEFQERCAVEVDAVLEDATDVAWSHLPSLKFLTRCIKESLRLYGPIPTIAKVLNKDIHVEGKTILKGTMVFIAIDGALRHKSFWKDNRVFDPDRFIDDNVAEQYHHAYIPFSAGPRNCIGQNFAMTELKVVLAKLLRNFRFTVDVEHTIVPCHELIYRSKTGVYLFVEPRNNFFLLQDNNFI